jgi:hypothetical protein
MWTDVLHLRLSGASRARSRSWKARQIGNFRKTIKHAVCPDCRRCNTSLRPLWFLITKSLNLAVRRNQDRFPADFMFQLTAEEAQALRSQIETSKPGRGGRRYLPYAFTQHGVAMLSSVLRSKRAVQMNVVIIRAFVRLREIFATHGPRRAPASSTYRVP